MNTTDTLNRTALIDALTTTEQHLARLRAAQLRLLATLARHRSADPIDCTEEEITAALHWSPTTTRTRLRVAETLATRFPETLDTPVRRPRGPLLTACQKRVTIRLSDSADRSTLQGFLLVTHLPQNSRKPRRADRKPPPGWKLAGTVVAGIVAITVAWINHLPGPGPNPPSPPTPTPVPTPTITSASPRPSPSPTALSSTVTTVPATSAPPSPPSPAIEPHSWYYIANSSTGACLSYYALSPKAGPGTCGSFAPTDGWQYLVLQPGIYELINKNNGECLTERDMNGGVPEVAICNGAPSQQWTLRYAADSHSDTFTNGASGLCLTANGATNPVTIELDSCNKQPSQSWFNDGTL